MKSSLNRYLLCWQMNRTKIITKVLECAKNVDTDWFLLFLKQMLKGFVENRYLKTHNNIHETLLKEQKWLCANVLHNMEITLRIFWTKISVKSWFSQRNHAESWFHEIFFKWFFYTALLCLWNLIPFQIVPMKHNNCFTIYFNVSS